MSPTGARKNTERTGCLRGACFRHRLQHCLASPLLGSPLTLAVVESEASPLTVADLLHRRLRETDEIGRCGPRRVANCQSNHARRLQGTNDLWLRSSW